jgi:hypothetical protein
MKSFDRDSFSFDDMGIGFSSEDNDIVDPIVETSTRVGSLEGKVDEIRTMLNDRIMNVDDMVLQQTANSVAAVESLAGILLPLLYNLSSGADSDTIVWPADVRIPMLEEKITEVRAILKTFD